MGFPAANGEDFWAQPRESRLPFGEDYSLAQLLHKEPPSRGNLFGMYAQSSGGPEQRLSIHPSNSSATQVRIAENTRQYRVPRAAEIPQMVAGPL